MKILIAGYGYLGRVLGGELVAGGHEVRGLRRELGFDLLKLETLKNLPTADWVVFCQAPSREGDDYRRTYFEGTKNLLGAMNRAPTPRIIFISSTGVYGQRDGSWVDEGTNPVPTGSDPSESAKWLLETEEFLLKTGAAMILRLGGIYGPGRNRVAGGGRDPRLTAGSDPNLYTNRIRVEDAARAAILLMEKGRLGEIYLGVDDYPSTQKEFYEWLEARGVKFEKAEAGKAASRRLSNKRCSNRKIKELGMVFKYPSFREGYAEWL